MSKRGNSLNPLTKNPKPTGKAVLVSTDEYDTGDLTIDVARRLIMSRVMVGGRSAPGSSDYSLLAQKDFGKAAGFSQVQYHQYESGKRLLGVRPALALYAAYRLTLDWLYLGDPSGLTVRLNEARENLLAQDPELPQRINEDLQRSANARRRGKSKKAPRS